MLYNLYGIIHEFLCICNMHVLHGIVAIATVLML